MGSRAGIPVAVKDLIDTADMPTGYGSTIYQEHRPEEDTVAVAHLQWLGTFLIGKTVTAEFAWRRPGPADALGRAFRQNAFVWVSEDAVPQLVLLR
jgi:Asp-tRNA(Asn)/Glu-tRNA(Gln) amidotransferase A subunit family amidase